ncbi:uncharacterized protein LOC113004787 isoform X1 [Solenopsis invicta]|uniref:uncharacterized protein LOC113004787 isoform X1 n=1 Tax=Solenopsis invicta TaxID=13686 RepID=UPI00193E697E|nr:uncharacterized protein LOC113004787 isoform X1 [Solenopsis invicta]XP_039305048.1 uncharacterized protein LOC113004787 isoform X1 [Solenopsis invicta]
MLLIVDNYRVYLGHEDNWSTNRRNDTYGNNRYSKKTNQEYAFKITNTTDGKKELPPESLSRGERPVNAQLMGKSSGKLLVYLQPSTKNQEERDYRSDLSHDDLARSINFAAPKIISESAGGVAA